MLPCKTLTLLMLGCSRLMEGVLLTELDGHLCVSQENHFSISRPVHTEWLTESWGRMRTRHAIKCLVIPSLSRAHVQQILFPSSHLRMDFRNLCWMSYCPSSNWATSLTLSPGVYIGLWWIVAEQLKQRKQQPDVVVARAVNLLVINFILHFIAKIMFTIW